MPPRSGFKRYQLDKLAFPEHPEPRVLSYAARRELADTAKGDDAPKRLRGAYSEVRQAVYFFYTMQTLTVTKQCGCDIECGNVLPRGRPKLWSVDRETSANPAGGSQARELDIAAIAGAEG